MPKSETNFNLLIHIRSCTHNIQSKAEDSYPWLLIGQCECTKECELKFRNGHTFRLLAVMTLKMTSTLVVVSPLRDYYPHCTQTVLLGELMFVLY